MPLSSALIDYISSLLASRTPIIISSRIPSTSLIDFLLPLFAKIFDENNQVLKPNHPDILILDNSAKNLEIESIRGIEGFISKKNFELKSQLIIIKEVANIGGNQANALLKLIEESGSKDYSIVFFTIHSISRAFGRVSGVLETLSSRCALVHIPETFVKVASDISTISDIRQTLNYAAYSSVVTINRYVKHSLLLCQRMTRYE